MLGECLEALTTISCIMRDAVPTAGSVSVVIPTRDRPDLLLTALRSVVRQGHRVREIIVVDDGERQVDSALVRRLDDRVTIVRTDGCRGASHARNAGAQVAGGDLLAFLDDDDWWHESFLAETLAALGRSGADVAAAGSFDVAASGRSWNGKRAPKTLCPSGFLRRNGGVKGSNLVVRRALFERIGGFDERLRTSNDIDFAIRLGLAAASYACVDRRLVYCGQHRGPRLTEISRQKVLGTLRFLRKHRPLMDPPTYRFARARALAALFLYLFRTRRKLALGCLWRGGLLHLPALIYEFALIPKNRWLTRAAWPRTAAAGRVRGTARCQDHGRWTARAG